MTVNYSVPMFIMAICFVALATSVSADGTTLTPTIGSLNTDHLGGVGSSKSVGGLDLSIDRGKYVLGVRLWHIAEKLDDDEGISPQSGVSLDIDLNLPGHWRVGGALIATDNRRFAYASAGIGSKHAAVSLLIPVNDSRFGLRARLIAPLAGQWHALAHYEYTGRQDPDIKIVYVGFGVGRKF